ncbi:membrane protein [Agrococcus versicolor]|uniref:Membrane protein n=1 Tax=Agrococcus versicolor TaxID=501482 RepID=A0ABN3AIH1_9MICO
MLESLLWGGVAAASLLAGAVLAVLRRWPPMLLGLVLAFGAGALIASIAFELAEEGLRVGGAVPVAIGLALGAATFFLADRLVERIGARDRDGGAGMPLAVGALLDGIPEQAVLGIGLAAGEGVSAALVVAIVLSNLPESIGSSADMLRAGSSRRHVLLLWTGVAIACALATVGGTLVADLASPAVQAGIDGFAAGALLVMLIDAMVPEARAKAKDWAGLATVLGFAVAAGLSLLGS